MELYDSFVDNMSSHPKIVQDLEVYRNKQIIKTIDKYVTPCQDKKVLEVGVGIGTFADEISKLGYQYTGVDRNEKMVKLFSDKYRMILGSLPPLPEDLERGSFDLAYAAFVAEHMADGLELFYFVKALKETVKDDGVVALIMPDARSMGIEFWNQDYTHRYPTTERNVSMICEENDLKIEKIIYYRGPFLRYFGFWLLKIGFSLYSYRWMGRLFGHKALFYSIYQYCKIDVMMFICRKNKK